MPPNSNKVILFVVFAVAIIAIILAYQLFIEPITGVANNGDFERVTQPFGLLSSSTTYTDKYFNYVDRYWQFGDREHRSYITSQQLLIQIGIIINHIISKTEGFDIICMGIVHSLSLIPAIILLTYTLIRSLGTLRASIIFSLILLFFFDSGYITYFNSFYSEAIAIISLFYITASTLAIMRLPLTKKGNVVLLLTYFVFSILFVLSKNQFALLAPVLAWNGFRLGLSTNQSDIIKWSALVSICLPIIMVLYFSNAVPSSYSQFNRFNSIFTGILTSSSNPKADLIEMGIDPQYASLVGLDYWEVEEEVILSEEFDTSFFQKVTFSDIILFYFRHPNRLIDQIVKASKASIYLASDELGHYEKSAGFPPRTHSNAFSLWSFIRSNPVFGSELYVLGFYLTNLFTILYKVRCIDRNNKQRNETEFHFALLISSLILFFAALIGDGQNEIVKHLLIFNFLRDTCLIILLAELLWIFQNMRITLPLQFLRTNKTKL